MLRSDARHVTLFSALGFALVTACSGAPGPGERGEDDATGAKTGKSSSNDEASGTNTGSNQTGTNPPRTTTSPTDPAPAKPTSPTSPTGPGTDCSGQKSLDSCMQCCIATNAAAWDQSVQVFAQCAQQECKGVCQSNPGSLKCAQCPLDCIDKADLWCQQNAQCAPVLQCVTSSKCEEKL